MLEAVLIQSLFYNLNVLIALSENIIEAIRMTTFTILHAINKFLLI